MSRVDADAEKVSRNLAVHSFNVLDNLIGVIERKLRKGEIFNIDTDISVFFRFLGKCRHKFSVHLAHKLGIFIAVCAKGHYAVHNKVSAADVGRAADSLFKGIKTLCSLLDREILRRMTPWRVRLIHGYTRCVQYVLLSYELLFKFALRKLEKIGFSIGEA